MQRERLHMAEVMKINASESKLINLTGHDVYLGESLVVPREGKPVRLINGRILDGELVIDDESGIALPIYKFNPEAQVVGLPDPEDGTLVIVSAMVRKHLTTHRINRPDVVSPYAVEIRNIRGEEVQCASALAR